MQPLPKGLTGFDALELDGVSVERFTTICQTAAKRVDGNLIQVRAAYVQVTPNFHEAVMTLRGGKETVRVLCNAHIPIVAFASPATRAGDICLKFLDCPDLARWFSGEFTVLRAQDACAGIAPSAISELGEAELDQLHYWNPKRIGDVIFNYWD